MAAERARSGADVIVIAFNTQGAPRETPSFPIVNTPPQPSRRCDREKAVRPLPQPKPPPQGRKIQQSEGVPHRHREGKNPLEIETCGACGWRYLQAGGRWFEPSTARLRGTCKSTSYFESLPLLASWLRRLGITVGHHLRVPRNGRSRSAGLQAGGRRFDPGWLHRRIVLRAQLVVSLG